MPRPKLPDNERKTERVEVPLTAEDSAALDKAAPRTRAEYVRDVLRAALRRAGLLRKRAP